MNLNIRTESKNDYAEIYQLVTDAFANAEHSDGNEQDLVGLLRASEHYIPELALVAEMDSGRLAGHIMFTTAHVGETTVLAVGPLAVPPDLQSKGIGSALIKAGHRIAREMGYEFCVLTGHANYYPRFGYRPASEFGIRAPFDVPDDCFMAYPLQTGLGRLDGVMKYPAEWGV